MAAAASAGGGAVVRSGHLRKLKTMKKKFFVLRGDSSECSARLEYYESEKKFKAGALPRRALPLRSCFNITRRLDLKQKHVIALFTKEEQFCVVAESEPDLHEWLSALLRLHRADDHSDQITHPIQHVWQVNVQKKGLGASKNIQGLYNLCLTDKTLTLVKIKSHNNVISELGIPERVEYTLKNIRRCGDSECFFYMEVGRQTVTGAGELWMLSDDSNIAQSMHSTIYHAMRNCAKESENERDHIVLPGKGTLDSNYPLPTRRQTLPGSDGRGRGALNNVEISAANNPLTSDKPRHITEHHRTVSLPAGCALFHEPLRIVHERTRSAPLTGDEVDRVITEKAVMHSSCRAINGTDAITPAKKSQWSRRRASTGTKLSKLSPAHSKNSTPMRHRCDSVPARTGSSLDSDRRTPVAAVEGGETSRDETDSEWLRTPRIPEEPDWWSPGAAPAGDGYLPMAPGHDHSVLSVSSGSVCSGTPNTHPRFSEYPLERATALISGLEEAGEGVRAARAYSVGSRPAPPAPHRHRAYSAGAARRAAPDLMELDFTNLPARSGDPAQISWKATAGIRCERRADVDEYVDMSPRSGPGLGPRAGITIPGPQAGIPIPGAGTAGRQPPDGYVEMSYGKPRAAPGAAPPAPPAPAAPAAPPAPASPLGSQTIFPFSPEEEGPHPLTTLREISEDSSAASGWHGGPPSPSLSTTTPGPVHSEIIRKESDPIVTATVVVAGGAAARRGAPAEGPPAPLNYAALDLEPRRPPAPPPPRQYTQIDFLRSEQLHAADHS